MHVVDDVEGIYINLSLPLHHIDELVHNIIIVKDVTGYRAILRSDLLLGNFIDTAVKSVKETLSKVSTCSEELHLFTDDHGGYAASDTVIIAVNNSHEIVVLVLDGRCGDGDLSAVLLPALGKSG